jgi:hypothetical protein
MTVLGVPSCSRSLAVKWPVVEILSPTTRGVVTIEAEGCVSNVVLLNRGELLVLPFILDTEAGWRLWLRLGAFTLAIFYIHEDEVAVLNFYHFGG